MAAAGFVDIDGVDLTPAFVETARAWLDECERHADQLAALEPPGAFDERQRVRRAQLAAVEDGLLRRGLFSASRAPRRETLSRR